MDRHHHPSPRWQQAGNRHSQSTASAAAAQRLLDFTNGAAEILTALTLLGSTVLAWPMPIHQLLLQNKVNVVFHGHDHFYAKQELDGIVYQEVPQPGFPSEDRVPRFAAEYVYKSGVIRPSSGYLRVMISPESARVDDLRTKPLNAAQMTDYYRMLP